jgi:hypothetical protein
MFVASAALAAETRNKSMTGEAEAHLGGQEAARESGVPAVRDIDADDLPRIADVLDEETFRRPWTW